MKAYRQKQQLRSDHWSSPPPARVYATTKGQQRSSQTKHRHRVDTDDDGRDDAKNGGSAGAASMSRTTATTSRQQTPEPPIHNPLCVAKYKGRTEETHQKHLALLQKYNLSAEGPPPPPPPPQDEEDEEDALRWKKKRRKVRTVPPLPPPPKVLMLGDSMVERFQTTGKAFVKAIQHTLHMFLAGVGGDRIENMVYRLHHGLLLNHFPGNIVFVMAGTNNIERSSAVEVAVGVTYLVDMILAHKPDTQVVVFGLLPRDLSDVPKPTFGNIDLMRRIDECNTLLSQTFLHHNNNNNKYHGTTVTYRYSGGLLRGNNGLKRDYYYDDHVHLNKEGYKVFYAELCEAVADYGPFE
jgi:lysophospholipase L1-like esterase